MICVGDYASRDHQKMTYLRKMQRQKPLERLEKKMKRPSPSKRRERKGLDEANSSK